MPPYAELFPRESRVRVASASALSRFRQDWKYHHPLAEEQLAFADRETVVAEIGFYHGGDVIYTLRDVPGVWHEACLVGIE